jgi:putative spermidine/putrescine transport system substrate-binding protein
MRRLNAWIPGLVVVTILMTTGCGSSATTGNETGGSSKYPESQYPASIFKNLSGTVGYYDTTGGQTYTALQDTFLADFTNLTGVKFVDDYNSSNAKFIAASQNGQVPWSLVELPSLSDLIQSEKAGYLQPIDTKIVPVDKLLPGSYDKYGINVGTFGFVLAWNEKKWPANGPHPSTMKDLYDLNAFPGKRCMFQFPEYGWTLESALLADGVSPQNLYPLDVTRAYNKLNTIKSSIVWWSSGAASIQDFENGSCDLGIIWSGRAYVAVHGDNFPLGISWNQVGYTASVWAIPKGAPNAKAAEAFLRLTIEDKAARVAYVQSVTYPMPAGATDISLDEFPDSLAPFLPTAANLKVAIPENDAYYLDHYQSLVDQFTSWVGQ